MKKPALVTATRPHRTLRLHTIRPLSNEQLETVAGGYSGGGGGAGKVTFNDV
jgi:hypothetical protein